VGQAIAELALQMGSEVKRVAAESGVQLEVRIGVDNGSVVAGVIGQANFIYDLWGDTVNTASRMESHAQPGTVQVTERTYQCLREEYELLQRGTIEVKGKGPMRTYLLVRRRSYNDTPPRSRHSQPTAPTTSAEMDDKPA